MPVLETNPKMLSFDPTINYDPAEHNQKRKSIVGSFPSWKPRSTEENVMKGKCEEWLGD